MNKVIAVVGPTGSGKTKLAVELARKFNGVIISADSRQVYRGLDVGTNKEGTPGRWNGCPARIIDDIPQLLIDIVDPGEQFTLNNWLTQARDVLELIFKAGRLPIVVGGTGLYVSALLDGYQLGGGRFAKNNQPVDFQSLVLMPDADRAVLYERSDTRCARIFDALIDETKNLLDSGLSGDWLNKIGLDYRYAFKSISGDLDRDEAVKQFQAASRAYIRRQLTWWRHHGNPVLIKTTAEAELLGEKFLLS